MTMCWLSPEFKKCLMHVNYMNFKIFCSFSWGFPIFLSFWAVKERGVGREEDELIILHPINLMGLL